MVDMRADRGGAGERDGAGVGVDAVDVHQRAAAAAGADDVGGMASKLLRSAVGTRVAVAALQGERGAGGDPTPDVLPRAAGFSRISCPTLTATAPVKCWRWQGIRCRRSCRCR